MLNFGSPRKSCWSVDEREVLIRFSGPWRACVACLRLRFAESLALFNRFSSSEPEANSSETYSSTTLQPSALLSAIRINFWRLRINSLPSTIKLVRFLFSAQEHSPRLTWKIESIWALCSNCLWLPLNFMRVTFIGHYRNVRGLEKSMVVFRLFEKLRYANERSTIF